jgi:hypothetical protein
VNRILQHALLIGLAGIAPAFGQFAVFSQPTTAYTSGTTLIAITDPDGTSESSISGGGQTITFSSNLFTGTVPTGGWSTWGSPPNTESATPRVVDTTSAITTMTLTLSTPEKTFGFEVEPDSFGTFAFTFTFMNNSTVLGSIPLSIEGDSGALVSAASDNTPITSVVISAPAGADGFALAQFRFSPNAIQPAPSGVPIPSSVYLGIAGLVFLAFFLTARERGLV